MPMVCFKLWHGFQGRRWMQFELDSSGMESANLLKPGKLCFQLVKPVVPFTATPMVLPGHCQEDIAQTELGFGDVASDKVLLLGSDLGSQEIFGEQQTGAAVKQQPRGFRQRNSFR